MVGRTLADVEDCDEPDDKLLSAAVAALREARAHHEVFVGGTSKLAAAFDAVEQLSEVLGLLEKQLVVVTLMRRVIDRGLRVAIGEETGVPSLADCSLVLAPYSTEGSDGGTIAVIGPTRMGLSAGAIGGGRGEPPAGGPPSAKPEMAGRGEAAPAVGES